MKVRSLFSPACLSLSRCPVQLCKVKNCYTFLEIFCFNSLCMWKKSSFSLKSYFLTPSPLSGQCSLDTNHPLPFSESFSPPFNHQDFLPFPWSLLPASIQSSHLRQKPEWEDESSETSTLWWEKEKKRKIKKENILKSRSFLKNLPAAVLSSFLFLLSKWSPQIHGLCLIAEMSEWNFSWTVK